MKPFAYFSPEILIVLEASGGCCESLWLVWNLQEVVAKPFAHVYIKTFMVLNFQKAVVKTFT